VIPAGGLRRPVPWAAAGGLGPGAGPPAGGSRPVARGGPGALGGSRWQGPGARRQVGDHGWRPAAPRHPGWQPVGWAPELARQQGDPGRWPRFPGARAAVAGGGVAGPRNSPASWGSPACPGDQAAVVSCGGEDGPGADL